MNRAALRRLIRRALLLPLGKRHRPRREVRREKTRRDEEWEQEILDLLPPTPRVPDPAEPADAWAPRITRWIRLACPLPDDTILLSPIPAATVLEFMGRGFLWDPR